MNAITGKPKQLVARGRKAKGKQLNEEEMRQLLKENKKSISGMTKQLYDIEKQAHGNRREVEGVRATVDHILKQYEAAMKNEEEGNQRLIVTRINEQVQEVSNILVSHESIFGDINVALQSFSKAATEDDDYEDEEIKEIITTASPEAFADFSYELRRSTNKVVSLFDTLKAKIKSTKEVLAKSDQISSLLSEAEAEVVRLTEAMEVLKSNLEMAFQEQVNAANDRGREWERKFKDAQKALNALESSSSSLQQNLKREISSLEDTNATLTGKLNSHIRELNESRESVTLLTANVHNLESELEIKTQELRNMSARIAKLEDNLAKQQLALVKQRTEFEQQRKENEEDEAAKASTVIEELKNQVKLLELTSKSKAKEILTLNESVDLLKNENSELKETHEREIEDLLDEARRHALEMEEMQAAYEEKLETLKSKLVADDDTRNEDLSLLDDKLNAEIELRQKVEANLAKVQKQLQDSLDKAPMEPKVILSGVSQADYDALKVANESLQEAFNLAKEQLMEAKRSAKPPEVKEPKTHPVTPAKPKTVCPVFVTVGVQTDFDERSEVDETDMPSESDVESEEEDKSLPIELTPDEVSDLKKSGDFGEKSKQLARIFAFIRDNNLRMLDVYSSLDVDNTGHITRSNFTEGMCRLIEGSLDNEVFFSDEILESIFFDLDGDKNGVLTYKKFDKLRKQFKRREVRHFAKGFRMAAKSLPANTKRDNTASLQDRFAVTKKSKSSDAWREIARLESEVERMKSIHTNLKKAETKVQQLSSTAESLASQLRSKNAENTTLINKVKQYKVEAAAFEKSLSIARHDADELRTTLDEERQNNLSSALNASEMSLDGQLVKMTHRVLCQIESLALLGIRGLSSEANNFHTQRVDTAGEFRSKLTDLQGNCNLVFNCLHMRYPALAILRKKPNPISFGTANLPSIVTGKKSFDDCYELNLPNTHPASRPASIHNMRRMKPLTSQAFPETIRLTSNTLQTSETNISTESQLKSKGKTMRNSSRFVMSPLRSRKAPRPKLHGAKSMRDLSEKVSPMLFVGYHPSASTGGL